MSYLYEAKKLVNWFDRNDEKDKFELWKMNNEEKRDYASYLVRIGGYYRRCAKYQQAIEYYIKAKKVFNEVKGYEALKCSINFTLAISYIEVGELQEAKINIQRMEGIFNKDSIDKTDITTLYGAKAKLFNVLGEFQAALKNIDISIDVCVEKGMNPQDLYLAGNYLLKAEILNNLARYKEAYSQVEQVYNMNKPSKKEDDQVFGRIFTQMSRAELGLGKTKEALEYAKKAETIFINDSSRPNKNITTSADTELAKAYVAKGDALAA